MAGSLAVRKRNARKQQNKSLTPVERQVQKLFGLNPKLVRNQGVAPVALNPTTNRAEWAVPQILYDMASDFVTPGLAAAGQPIGDPEAAASRFALNFTGTGGVASRMGRGAVGKNRAVLGMSGAPKAAKVVKGAPSLAVSTKAPSILAYHGSPHSFDRFDLSKVGTGEGAQAYGHGLYFAEAEPVAQEYRQRLAEITAAPFDRIGIPPSEWNAATMFARQMDPTLPDVAARDFAQWVGRDVTPELVDAFRVAKQPGSMYQVRINADPNRLLNWDQPIIAQSPEIQQAALSAARDADISHLGSGHRSRVKLERFMDAAEQPHDPIKGSELMMAIDRSPGNNFAPETSALLRQYGIPGLKYLDQASRAAGEGSRNYVVFDDALIDLLRKYAMGGSVKPSPSQ